MPIDVCERPPVEAPMPLEVLEHRIEQMAQEEEAYSKYEQGLGVS